MSGSVQSSPRPRGRPRKEGAPAPQAASLAQVQLHHQHQHHHQQHHHHQQQQQHHHLFHPQLRIPVPGDDEKEQLQEEGEDDPDQSHHLQHQQHQHHQHHPHHQQQMEQEDGDQLLVQQKKKEIKRSWREEWKIHHKWVYPITRENGELRLKCHWCTAFNMENVFAKEGCSTIQLSALNTHAKSEAHKTAESRWETSDAAINALTVPDNLWPFGGKVGNGEADAGDGLEGPELNGGGGATPAGASEAHNKRKFTSQTTNNGAGAKLEGLGSILQKNNSRIVEVLLEAESGRSKRHSIDVSLLKKHYALEDQRQRLDSERLQFERARLEAMVQLGQQYNAALTNIGTGLLKIGAALESKKGL